MASKFHTCYRATLPVALFLLLASSLLAQQGPGIDPSAGPFPDAPQPAQVTNPLGANDSQRRSTGGLSGTVFDTNRDVLQEIGRAHV